ncbi:MAG: permease, partial [Sedimentisphaerales bacterium]|nr:permease [Sedimentisphaerales bacterium]
ARVLGVKLGLARAVGAILFSVVIGLLMHLIYRKEEFEKSERQMAVPETEVSRPLWQNSIYFAAMVGILVFANWARPTETGGLWHTIYSLKWIITGIFGLVLASTLLFWFKKSELSPWLEASWGFAKQILPLLFLGVLVAGALLGRPEHEGLIPSSWVAGAVGGNSVRANLFASVAGALMYFATLTEVPIIQGLLGAGMGKGPALALLLAGPALSLPNMLVIRSVMGTKKTIVFVGLVVVMATISGVIFGTFF